MTIAIILALLFIAGIGACVAAALVIRRRQGKSSAAGKRKITLVLGAAGVFALLFLLLPFSFHTVIPGQVAVVKVWGKASYVRTPGTYFDFWISKQYAPYDTKVQQADIATMCYSSDAQTMDVELVVQYQIQSDHAIDIANNYGALELLNNRIQSISIEKAKTVLSQKSAMAIIETRSTISPAIEQIIKETVVNDYYVDIVTVVVTNIDFSDAFETTVEEKMIAEQEKLKAQFEKEKAIIEAEKELEVAKLAAQAAVAKAEGDAEAVLKQSEAQAKATKLRSVEIARMLGFDITETVTEEGILYDIDFTDKQPEEIKLISEYLKYVTYLESWDGKLPTTFVTDGSAQVIIPANPAG